MTKAKRLLGYQPRLLFEDGHRQTYEWFNAQGWAGLTEPLSDPVWRSSWNFDAEDQACAMLTGQG